MVESPRSYSGERGRAIQALARIGPSARSSVPTLVRALTDQEGYVRQTAAAALVDIGSVPREAVPDLMAVMEEQKTVNPWFGAYAVVAVYLAEPTPGSLARILSNLTTGDSSWRPATAEVLGHLQELPSEAIPLLREMLHDQEVRVRHSAAIGLARKDSPDLAEVIPLLIDGVQNDSALNFECAMALGKIGPAAGAALPALAGLSKHRHVLSSQIALRAMDQIKGGK
jgi:HEAT repeat protein